MILPSILSRCKTLSITLFDEVETKVFENTTSKMIYRSIEDGDFGERRKVHDDEFQELFICRAEPRVNQDMCGSYYLKKLLTIRHPFVSFVAKVHDADPHTPFNLKKKSKDTQGF